MKSAGVALVVAGILAFIMLAIGEGPEPRWFCGGSSNLKVALFGYRDSGELGDACRSDAVRGTVKAAVIGGVLLLVGTGLAAAGADRERAGPPPGYGTRSHDGRWWWDGHRWQPVGPPPPPPPG